MRLTKYKREFSRKIPYIFLNILLIALMAAISFFASAFYLSKQTIFISPLAQNETAEKAQNDLEHLLYKNNIFFSKIEIATDSSYIVFLKDQGQVNFDQDKNLESQVSSLQLILSRLTIEGKKFKRLDLRYELPTIEF